jgi:hypothetical protein
MDAGVRDALRALGLTILDKTFGWESLSTALRLAMKFGNPVRKYAPSDDRNGCYFVLIGSLTDWRNEITAAAAFIGSVTIDRWPAPGNETTVSRCPSSSFSGLCLFPNPYSFQNLWNLFELPKHSISQVLWKALHITDCQTPEGQ